MDESCRERGERKGSERLLRSEPVHLAAHRADRRNQYFVLARRRLTNVEAFAANAFYTIDELVVPGSELNQRHADFQSGAVGT
jgi:hypothetical protein